MPKPDFSKSPPELVARFDSVTRDYPDVQRRISFGYPVIHVGGHMVTGLHGSGWFVRLGEPSLAEALALEGAGPFEVMPGRPINGYALLPRAVIDDDRLVQQWVERAIAFGASLPPKPAKPPKSAKTNGARTRAV